MGVDEVLQMEMSIECFIQETFPNLSFEERQKLVDELIITLLEEGYKAIKVVWGYFYAYEEHLKRNSIKYIKNKKILIVLVDKNYKHFGHIVGMAEAHYILDGNFGRHLLKKFSN